MHSLYLAVSFRMLRGTSSKQVYRISICDNCHATLRRRSHMSLTFFNSSHECVVVTILLTITFVCKQVSTFLLNLERRWKSELFCLGQLPTEVKQWSFLSSQVLVTTKIFPKVIRKCFATSWMEKQANFNSMTEKSLQGKQKHWALI